MQRRRCGVKGTRSRGAVAVQRRRHASRWGTSGGGGATPRYDGRRRHGVEVRVQAVVRRRGTCEGGGAAPAYEPRRRRGADVRAKAGERRWRTSGGGGAEPTEERRRRRGGGAVASHEREQQHSAGASEGSGAGAVRGSKVRRGRWRPREPGSECNQRDLWRRKREAHESRVWVHAREGLADSVGSLPSQLKGTK